MTSTLKKIIIAGIILMILAFSGSVYFNSWLNQKMQKVELGLSEPAFPYRDYTEEELAKMYPQIKYADVATRTTPEETYSKFRQALKDNNLELALEQLSKSSTKRYKEYVDTLTNYHKENKFQELYQYYPEKITKVYMAESIGQYEYDHVEDGKVFLNSIDFTKDANGDWKLDSL